MKRWIIADRSSLQILSGYSAELSQQSVYGGPWGDASKTIHVAIPMELESMPVSRLEVAEVQDAELTDEEGDVIVDLVPGPTEVAHDTQGRVILNEEGKPTLVSSWTYQPRLGPAIVVRVKSV